MHPTRCGLDELAERFQSNGFYLHLDVGDLFDQAPGLDPVDFDLGGGLELPFDRYTSLSELSNTYVPNHFKENNPERDRAFYYILIANWQSIRFDSSSVAPDRFSYFTKVTVGELINDTPTKQSTRHNQLLACRPSNSNQGNLLKTAIFAASYILLSNI